MHEEPIMEGEKKECLVEGKVGRLMCIYNIGRLRKKEIGEAMNTRTVGSLGAQVSMVKGCCCWVQLWVFPIEWRG